jgi:hypothetical protein
MTFFVWCYRKFYWWEYVSVSVCGIEFNVHEEANMYAVILCLTVPQFQS